jgi:hypothetical protein
MRAAGMTRITSGASVALALAAPASAVPPKAVVVKADYNKRRCARSGDTY